jgi:hypothetical protein
MRFVGPSVMRIPSIPRWFRCDSRPYGAKVVTESGISLCFGRAAAFRECGDKARSGHIGVVRSGRYQRCGCREMRDCPTFPERGQSRAQDAPAAVVEECVTARCPPASEGRHAFSVNRHAVSAVVVDESGYAGLGEYRPALRTVGVIAERDATL